ncbi:MAG: TIGR03790 family protein [Bryobacteraceae bacterium]
MSRLALLLIAGGLLAQTPENVLVVVNQSSAISRTIGDYYVLRRRVPLSNVCGLKVADSEIIARQDYDREIAAPIARFLRSHHLEDKILYIVTTSGVPLKIASSKGTVAVDSELTLLYRVNRAVRGQIANPFFGKRTAKFTHPEFPIYLVTRLR